VGEEGLASYWTAPHPLDEVRLLDTLPLVAGGGTTGVRTFLPALPLQPAEHDQSL
jgi:hypothetical protein